MKTLILTLLTILAGLTSPDGKMKLSVSNDADAHLYYSVSLDGNEMVSPSPLGMVTNDADYSRLSLADMQESRICEDYFMDRIKKSTIHYEANCLVLSFNNPDGRRFEVEFRLSDSDLAFRYRLPKDSETGSVRVLKELTGFRFPDGTTSWLCPQSDAMVGWKRTKPSYEEYYKLDRPLSERSDFGHGFTFPCLFKTGGHGWVLVSETGVDSRYCGSRLSDWDNGYTIEFPMPEENNGNGTVEPAFSLPGATPWRTLSIGSDLKPVVESTVTWDVVEPRYVSEHRYSYGKGTWSWILWQDGSINAEDQKTYIDLAASMGFQYTLVDNWWDTNIGKEGVEELARYAENKGVGLFMWYSSSGWWNDIVQGPINVMSDPIARKKEMKWLRSIGVKGIKVDFFGGDKQETMRHYESILSDADDFGLMVIFHGCTLPRGWERMYPNYVGSEAVRASENLIFSQYDCDIEAVCACLHPYIRNAVGCMEYGGSFLNRYMDRRNGVPDERGRVHGNIRRTSDVFSLCTAVIFQNPIQNFALAPNNLEDAPDLAMDFMREVPTIWDDTRYLAGEPGKSCVIARRHGSKWYVAAVNAAKEPLKLDVRKVAAELGYSTEAARVIATVDGAPAVVTKFKKPLAVPANDGVAMVFE